ncbi:MAG: altronate oxidoreductase [Balneola sp.]|jgi:tagaturonate reductase|nr:altronate oxidoreductase [Balneola sp.]MBE77537.1 altronate oxidoreductase [Balneola sp.]HBX64825.1 tagaturonate reductase [Balneolaceae bacterium]|tara:strand:+ start:400 stop:1815 length:1416 start_codon:yes stop_codon:yes gene_type:complete
MKSLSRDKSEIEKPLKVIQFGEGNFLRAFIDWMIDIFNKETDYNGGVAIVQPIEHGMVSVLKEQDGLYHHLRQGIEGDQTIDEIRKIECITSAVNPFEEQDAFFNLAEQPEVDLIVSNTTEAGIEFKESDKPGDNELAVTFPGKLTQLLKHRFDHFGGSADKAVSVLPCELIESNGDNLKQCILKYIELWDLSDEFKSWITEHTNFANTLVDRIVPGYPKDEIEEIKERIGYDDNLVVKSEAFHLFVVQAPKSLQDIFPAEKAGLNVKFVDDITPYRTQKVRILNGAHTSMVQIGLLSGLETVAEAIDHEVVGEVMQEIMFEEIVPTIQIPGGDPKEFAKEIKGRFKNPFIRHELIDISLNSVSKYKVRVLPTVLDYLKIKGELPKRLVFALACLIKLYKERHDQLRDDAEFLQFFSERQDLSEEELVEEVLSKESMWDQDLTEVDGMRDLVLKYYTSINSTEMLKAIQNI